MRALTDTHALLWWMLDDSRLSTAARDTFQQGSNEILVSAIVAFEIGVKAAAGRLLLPAPAEELVIEAMGAEGFGSLEVSVAHALRAAALPPIHRDPSDRLLIAQAQIEELPILTADPLIGRYDVETIW